MADTRVGLVGCGAAARRHHLPVLTSIPGIRVTALCDPSEEQMNIVETRFRLGAMHYSQLDDLLDCSELQVVHICSPGYLHYRQTLAAIRAGKHVLVEKPPAHSVTEAKELKAAAEATGVKVGCVLNTRYKPLIRELKALADAGCLGNIVKVHAVHHGAMVFADAPWLWDEQQSKYLLYENGIHLADLLVHLLGPHERVLHVECFVQPSVDVCTELQALVRFKNGATAFLDITQDTTRHSSCVTELRVFGTAQDATFRHFPPLLALTSGLLAPHQALWAELRSFCHFLWLLVSGRVAAYRNASHAEVISRFYRWIRDDIPYAETISEAIPTLELLEELAAWVPTYRLCVAQRSDAAGNS